MLYLQDKYERSDCFHHSTCRPLSCVPQDALGRPIEASLAHAAILPDWDWLCKVPEKGAAGRIRGQCLLAQLVDGLFGVRVGLEGSICGDPASVATAVVLCKKVAISLDQGVGKMI